MTLQFHQRIADACGPSPAIGIRGQHLLALFDRLIARQAATRLSGEGQSPFGHPELAIRVEVQSINTSIDEGSQRILVDQALARLLIVPTGSPAVVMRSIECELTGMELRVRVVGASNPRLELDLAAPGTGRVDLQGAAPSQAELDAHLPGTTVDEYLALEGAIRLSAAFELESALLRLLEIPDLAAALRTVSIVPAAARVDFRGGYVLLVLDEFSLQSPSCPRGSNAHDEISAASSVERDHAGLVTSLRWNISQEHGHPAFINVEPVTMSASAPPAFVMYMPHESVEGIAAPRWAATAHAGDEGSALLFYYLWNGSLSLGLVPPDPVFSDAGGVHLRSRLDVRLHAEAGLQLACIRTPIATCDAAGSVNPLNVVIRPWYDERTKTLYMVAALEAATTSLSIDLNTPLPWPIDELIEWILEDIGEGMIAHAVAERINAMRFPVAQFGKLTSRSRLADGSKDVFSTAVIDSSPTSTLLGIQ